MEKPTSPNGADFWNRWQQERNQGQTGYVDWGDHPTILELLYSDVFGSPATTVFDYLKQAYPEFANSCALSLCAGDGTFEKLLLAHNVFDTITGVDIAEVRVATANAQAGEFANRLQFMVGDVNQGEFGDKKYEVVFAKAALHHVEQLETLFSGIKKCLKPGGKLVAIDFFGPTRFQWTDAQLEAANHFLALIPDELLKRTDGSLHKKIRRPAVEDIIAADPSEAVRSSDIYPLLVEYFDEIRNFAMGGTLLNLIFDPTVINNFDPGNPSHNTILQAAFDYERKLMAENTLGSDFKFIIATAE